jgi:inhibitor of KinA sporulation pathway (predicted exonuclease)
LADALSTTHVTKVKQPFDFYAVLDFEATCEEGRRVCPQEIIEFPTVLLDARTMVAVGEFRTHVRPVRRPKLSSFCTSLTGITQHQVDAAPKFSEALRAHTAWLQARGLALDGSKGHSFAFVTCGDWDLRTMLPAQLALEHLGPVPCHFRRWVNLKKIYAKSMGAWPSGMPGMLRGLGLTLEGKHHSGIDDCRNIAKILKALNERGCLLQCTGGEVTGSTLRKGDVDGENVGGDKGDEGERDRVRAGILGRPCATELSEKSVSSSMNPAGSALDGCLRNNVGGGGDGVIKNLLAQLALLGLTDEAKNIKALQLAEYDPARAANFIFDGRV